MLESIEQESQTFDVNYFMSLIGSLNEELEQGIQFMTEEQEALEEGNNEALDWSLEFVEMEAELKIMLMELQIDYQTTEESFQDWQPDLIELQKVLNDEIVDDFNEAKDSMILNKERFAKLKKAHHQGLKGLDGYGNELNQKGN